MKKGKKDKVVIPIDLLLEELDGNGLVITDADWIKEYITSMGLTYDSKTVVIKK